VKKQDILMVGVGGQGTILASDILGEAALAAGYDVKKTDTLGMAQRGGSVVSHVRIAEQVWSPLIKEGEADIMLAFEKLEAARWGRYLRPGGVAIINNYAMPPLSVSLGTHRYPNDEEIREMLKQRTERIYFVEGTRKAVELGDIRVLNVIMLGCTSLLLAIDVHIWKECMSQRIPSKILKVNFAAFDQGRKEASDVNLG
jgi:indolepyruvate ferredoxin oxidoreductase beta subunit